jgi:hypothetical protein
MHQRDRRYQTNKIADRPDPSHFCVHDLKVSACRRDHVRLKGFITVSTLRSVVVLVIAATAIAGCERNPLKITRSACPAVAVPTYAGDITLFKPGTPPDAANLDVVATSTNVRESCSETPETLTMDVSYDVLARRTSAAGARTVTFPVFASVVQGGNLLVSKQTGSVAVSFADGQLRASSRGGARGTVARSATALPEDIQKKINRKRKAGDLDAASDPLAEPEVKAAMRAASFEVLVGFQLNEAQLGYNVTK